MASMAWASMALFKPLQGPNVPTLTDTKTLHQVFTRGKHLAHTAWSLISRRLRLLLALLLTLLTLTLSHRFLTSSGVPLPTLSIQHHHHANQPPFNTSKVALLIENRPLPLLAPLLLHFISVVPPDWRFRFMGSLASVSHINQSVAIQQQVASGKLDLTYIPSNMTVGSQEEISRFLTNLWVYETLLHPAEWLLIFQTDSMLCANSRRTLNDYLEYDWVGAPWRLDARFGGNGGLSLRRVSAIVDVLRNQVRREGSEPEDVWLTDRLGHRPGARLANGTVSAVFSGEQYPGEVVHVEKGNNKTMMGGYHNGTKSASQRGKGKGKQKGKHPRSSRDEDGSIPAHESWRDGFYEPMGYHTGNSGKLLPGGIWGTPALRKHIWDYCPEIKMTLQMDAAQFIPGDCGSIWKRDGEGSGPEERGWETEVIDGEEYPLLKGVMPWF